LFITKLHRYAEITGIDEQTQLFAALSGLYPLFAAHVMEHNPKKLEEILKFARIA
jgi:hypothetical protein